jgi:hypothetical protein
MKYLITESQLDRMINKYLDNQDFIQIERNDAIYFLNSELDGFAEIKYDMEDGRCFIHYKLIYEISSFFSIDEFDSKEVISRWVKNTLQMKVTDTSGAILPLP